MPEPLLDDFEQFFAELPSNVSDDLSFMMMILADESIVVREVGEVYEQAARDLFQASTRIGRIANLINAVSIVDVYFAMDVRKRFDADSAVLQQRGGGTKNAKASRDPYAREIDAIEKARQRWRNLRATKFAPAALAEALTPPKGSDYTRSSKPRHRGETAEVFGGAASGQ
jgi:hypothetical protein